MVGIDPPRPAGWNVPAVKLPQFAPLALAMTLFCGPVRAAQNPVIESISENTYSLTQTATNGFDLDTDRLKERALKHAADFCTDKHKEMKVIDTTVWRPRFRTLGLSYAKVVFKALDADDPELHAPPPAPPQPILAAGGADSAVGATAQPQSATDQLYSDLLKLDDLRKRGILTQKEYDAQKKRLLKSQK